MRVRDLLRMQTGQQTEPSFITPADSTLRSATWARRFLMHPVPFKPGTHFLYNSGATYMLSAIVQKVTGQNLRDYLTPRLFIPLGIESPTWVSSPQGINAGAYGLAVRTEDIAKLGQLYLQRGSWNGKQLIPASWVSEATSRQTSNGSSPASDWDQGYGYQFWRSRHDTYRGDGAFGQYMMVFPQQDAVVAITSGVRDMQSVMNLVWDKLLPAFSPAPLKDDLAARTALRTKLGGLTVRMPAGHPTSPLAARISGRWYGVPQNERGITAVLLDFSSAVAAVMVRTASGETRTPVGFGSWVSSRGAFNNGIDQMLSVLPQPQVAASGAWTADSVFTVKLVAPETPFYSTLTFTFAGNRLLMDTEYNVSFGARTLPRMEGAP